MGAFPTYQVLTSFFRGEIYCGFRHNCNKLISLSSQPDYFWASFVIWLAFSIFFFLGGCYVLINVVIKKRSPP